MMGDKTNGKMEKIDAPTPKISLSNLSNEGMTTNVKGERENGKDKSIDEIVAF
jgi:hypothetical protein